MRTDLRQCRLSFEKKMVQRAGREREIIGVCVCYVEALLEGKFGLNEVVIVASYMVLSLMKRLRCR